MKAARFPLLPKLPVLLLSLFCLGPCLADEPFADIHIHYNWDQKEIISAAEVIKRLRQANVGLTIVAGTPTRLALELRQAGGDWVLPFFSPYTHELGKRDWYRDQSVVAKAEQGLAQGLYYGIGEVHFMAGRLPRADNPVFVQLMALAERFRVPTMIHVDAGNEQFFAGICRAHPQVNILFAHAGGVLKPAHIETILQQCPNVWVELSARDPWRYGGISDKQQHLLPAWRELVLRYPERFLTGTDPVWRVTRTQSWDEPDDGWDHYTQLIQFHRHWLADLPPDIRHKIAWQNALRLFPAFRPAPGD
jgi:hypothetical protein